MAGESDRDESAFVKQTGLSVEAIEVTLRQHDRALGDISRKINDISTQSASQSAALRTELLGSISGLSAELRAQQKATIDNSRTPWIQLVLACVTVSGFVWAVGRGAITPLEDQQTRTDHAFEKLVDKTDEAFKQVYLALTPILSTTQQIKSLSERVASDEIVMEGKWSKDAQGEYEKRMDDKTKNLTDRLAELKTDILRTELELRSDLNVITTNLVTRAENTAHWTEIAQRIEALSARLNELQKFYNDIFPGNEVIKEMQAQLREMRQQLSVSPSAPSLVPIAPLMPASPKE